MAVDKPATPVVVPMLVKLFGEDDPQEEPALLPTITFPSSLLALLPEVSDLSVLAGLIYFVATHTSAVPPLLLSLALDTIRPVV